LIDKYVLTVRISNTKAYTFFIGALAIFVLPLIPLVTPQIPDIKFIALSFFTGIVLFFALYWFYKALQIFEPSRIVPAVGAFSPILVFVLVYIFSRGKEIFSLVDALAFILLILGGLLITYKNLKISSENILFAIIVAFLWAFHSVLAKYVYDMQPFWTGFIWIRVGTFLTAIIFLILFFKEIKQEFFRQGINFHRKTAGIVIGNQIIGTAGAVLENWAIALAPIVYISMIKALGGIQYVFLLIFAVLISWKFPQILREEISKKVLLQKIIAIFLIGIGLAILTLK